MVSRDKKAREGLQDLEQRFGELEHDFKMLKLEWEESYEKIASMLRKLGRRAEAIQKEADGGRTPLSPEEEALVVDGNHTPQFLSPRQRALQQQVLRRRAGTQ